MTELERAMVLPLLDGLAGLAPLGFEHAELRFERGTEHPWELAHTTFGALPGAPKLDELVDQAACARLLTHFASDLGRLLGEQWDGRLELERHADGWGLGCNAAPTLRVDHDYANRRTFDDEALHELARLRTTILERQGAFIEGYGLPEESWRLDPDAGRLATPAGELTAALLGVHAEEQLHWATVLDGPPRPMVEPVKALVASNRAPAALTRGRLVVPEAALAAPLGWLVAEPLGAETVLLWPHGRDMVLVLALLAL